MNVRVFKHIALVGPELFRPDVRWGLESSFPPWGLTQAGTHALTATR